MTSNEHLRVDPTIRQRARELRQSATPAERKLWQHLRRRQLSGHYFRRQHPIGRVIVDFCCTQARLVIEVDGGVHTLQEEYDAARTEWLQDRAYHVIRFTNKEILHQIDGVLETTRRL